MSCLSGPLLPDSLDTMVNDIPSIAFRLPVEVIVIALKALVLARVIICIEHEEACT
jgi:hypothetical protein